MSNPLPGLSPGPAPLGTALALAVPKPSLPQVFFSGHSDYFQALLDDHFGENEGLEPIGDLPAITQNLALHLHPCFLSTTHTAAMPRFRLVWAVCSVPGAGSTMVRTGTQPCHYGALRPRS